MTPVTLYWAEEADGGDGGIVMQSKHTPNSVQRRLRSDNKSPNKILKPESRTIRKVSALTLEECDSSSTHTIFELHIIWSMLSQPAHPGCLLACMRQSIICHPNTHQNAATNQRCWPQCELCSDCSLWTLTVRMNYRRPFLKPVYMLLIYSLFKWVLIYEYLPSQTYLR